jgi:uncharacterized SAM-binding protein YcdF (DUF218 family)
LSLLGLPRVFSPWWWVKRIASLVVFLYLLSAGASVWLAAGRDERRPVQAILVMGAAQYNGRPSPALQQRLDHALTLYRERHARLIIVTGGKGEGDTTTEASVSANYLIAKGVPDARIRREVQGKDSYESIAAARRFLADEDVSTVLIVTSGFHAARVKAVANEVGFTPYVSPVPSANGPPPGRMLTETAAVAIGRLFGYRRVTRFTRNL